MSGSPYRVRTGVATLRGCETGVNNRQPVYFPW
jgi:hypothetical protein